MQKVCSKCKVPKDIDEFYKLKRAADGHSATCKTCTKAYAKALSDKKIGNKNDFFNIFIG